MKSVAGTLRLELAQFRELEAFMQFAQDLDEETARRIDSGRRMVEVLKQGKGQPLAVEAQVAVLYAAIGGFLNGIAVERLREMEDRLVAYLDGQHRKILDRIRDSGAIEDDAKKELEAALEMFRKTHSEIVSDNE
jgi:F-type H+-transporting ATPase subunit alpha